MLADQILVHVHCMFSNAVAFTQRVAERSRLKSSILAVKTEKLQDAHSLIQELVEKDAEIAELRRQQSVFQAGGSTVIRNEDLARCQRKYSRYFT